MLADFKKQIRLPNAIDWYNPHYTVRQQGQTSSCVGQSGAGLKEMHEFQEHKKRYVFDGFKLYARCKKIDDYAGEGTYIRVMMKLLAKEGITKESIIHKPVFKISAYTKLLSILDIKQALLCSPVVIGVEVFNTFGKITKTNNWVVQMPSKLQKSQGGHAILITGYNQKGFHFVNSWGKEWGDNGTGWLSFEYIKKYMTDAWSAIDLDDLEIASIVNISKLSKALRTVKIR